MSKIGRKPIELSSVKVEVKDNTLVLSGPKAKFTHELPNFIKASVDDGFLTLSLEKDTRGNGILWGLHRALLANKVKGAQVGFEKKVKIVGLGYKAQLVGKKLNLSLGSSHKIDYDLPR